MFPRRLAALAAAIIVVGLATSLITRAQAGGPASLTAPDTAYEQDFDTLASSGTSGVLPTGWAFAERGSNANTTYTAGNGGGNAGDTYILSRDFRRMSISDAHPIVPIVERLRGRTARARPRLPWRPLCAIAGRSRRGDPAPERTAATRGLR